MLLNWNGKKHPVKVLLDTGCSIALLNQQTAEKLEVTLHRHPQPRRIENYMGEMVANAGQFLLEKLLVPRQSLGLPLLLYSFVEDTFTQERGSEKGYLQFFLYFSSSSIYLFDRPRY